MNRLLTRYIVIHHTVIPQDWAQTPTMNLILATHTKAGLAYDGEIAYHYVIGKDWAAVGRPESSVGYHAGNWLINLQSIAICLNGNFNTDSPNDFQAAALENLLPHLMAKYGITRDRIKLHSEVRDEPTQCPGKHLSQDYISKLLGPITINVAKEFTAIWHVPPAPGDLAYFTKRLTDGSISGLADLRVKLEFWYGKHLKDDQKWQKEKNDYLNSHK